jgi:hypothetical protein
VCDFIHTLSDADGRREVVDRVYPLEGAVYQRRVAHIPDHQLDLGVEIPGPPPFRPVDLGGHEVYSADAVTMIQQLIRQV